MKEQLQALIDPKNTTAQARLDNLTSNVSERTLKDRTSHFRRFCKTTLEDGDIGEGLNKLVKLNPREMEVLLGQYTDQLTKDGKAIATIKTSGSHVSWVMSALAKLSLCKTAGSASREPEQAQATNPALKPQKAQNAKPAPKPVEKLTHRFVALSMNDELYEYFVKFEEGEPVEMLTPVGIITSDEMKEKADCSWVGPVLACQTYEPKPGKSYKSRYANQTEYEQARAALQ